MTTPPKLSPDAFISDIKSLFSTIEKEMTEVDREQVTLAALRPLVYELGIQKDNSLATLPDYLTWITSITDVVTTGMQQVTLSGAPPVEYLSAFLFLARKHEVITLAGLSRFMAVLVGDPKKTVEEELPHAQDINTQLNAFTPTTLLVEKLNQVIWVLNTTAISEEDKLKFVRNMLGFDWSAAEVADPGVDGVLSTFVDTADAVFLDQFTGEMALSFVTDWFTHTFLPRMGRYVLIA